ncbi:MAG: o-succinylbenzoate--CoA ligase [Armatimonadota bacterium]|nr:o-succinylbenzoate--CoA ligase [Armatimonadota bacterium]MDR7454437.1 o-succinylbenzoate--CoA ligase [Armatimonadota bacterium]MDR7456040.1 o-succinylbenzoate--CoA ligase [Armatimonadota bacterium]MDR7496741.1 o-succinylbenzoate--CoA ligase [Armatimonadota bacterium]
MIVPDWLAARAAAAPDAEAVVAPQGALTFGALDAEATAAARRLAAAGVVAGARVALALGNGLPFAVLTHALARLGAVMVPLNTRLAAAEASWQLADSRAGLVICDDAHGALAASAARATGARVLPLDELEAAVSAEIVPGRGIDLSAPQGIIYTSATSGRPKGALLSFGNHWWNAIGSVLNLGLRSDDRWLVPLPLYHVGGLAVLWRGVIYGIPAVVCDRFDPDAANHAIDAGGVTVVSVVSTMLRRMLDARGDRPYPSTLRCVLTGGGPVPAELIERCLAAGVPVAPSYGLTEAASQVATLRPDQVARRPRSSGRPLLPVEVRVDGEEILVRGPTVMLGYAERPEETAAALQDGWLRTGDLGRLDDDGYLYVLDRREDLIVSGGENVYPAEVEAVLVQHPAVADAGVIGVPDPQWGQAVAAAVVPRSGAYLDEASVRAFCADRLAAYKVPRWVWTVDALPRGPGGKLLRHELRAQAARTAGTL